MTTIEKIKQLLKVTEENGASPAEAATALAFVQKLLFKNNLSMADVTDTEEEFIIEEEVSVGTKGVNKMQATFAAEIAQHFACAVLIRRNYKGTNFVFIGEKSKVDVLKECFLFAYTSYKYNWGKEVKSMDCSTRTKELLRETYGRGFIDGITNELVRSENEFALVVSKSQELDNYMNQKYSRTTPAKFQVSSIPSAEFYSRGYEAGSYSQRNKSKVITD